MEHQLVKNLIEAVHDQIIEAANKRDFELVKKLSCVKNKAFRYSYENGFLGIVKNLLQ